MEVVAVTVLLIKRKTCMRSDIKVGHVQIHTSVNSEFLTKKLDGII